MKARPCNFIVNQAAVSRSYGRLLNNEKSRRLFAVEKWAQRKDGIVKRSQYLIAELKWSQRIVAAEKWFNVFIGYQYEL